MSNCKDKLLKIIKGCRDKSLQGIGHIDKMKVMEQHIYDLADASERVISGIDESTGLDLSEKLNVWKDLEQRQDEILRFLDTPLIPLAEAGTTTVSYVMMDFTTPAFADKFSLPGKEEEVRSASINLKAVIDELADEPKALTLLNEFGMSVVAPGKQSPVELFETACSTFKAPATQGGSGSISSLIPIRECINNAIAILLKRRRIQEPAKNNREKIISICHQATKDGVSEQAVKVLADHWYGLNDELSSAKQQDIHREEWRELLNKAILFIIGFLQNLDQDKMRK